MKAKRVLLLITVFVAGMASLGVELSASRLLDPFFGNSLIIWAVLIGMVLLYLTVGYYLGGQVGGSFAPLSRPIPDHRLGLLSYWPRPFLGATGAPLVHAGLC